MPSALALPQIQDYRRAFHASIKGRVRPREDAHSGSLYDFVAGPSGILMARESCYLRDRFRDIYFGIADGDALTALIEGRYGIPRILDTYGTGTATLARASNAGGGGTIYEGTRVLIQSGSANGVSYAVAQDTPISATALYVAGLPIRATTTGIGAAIDTSVTGQPSVFDDPIFDNSWKPTCVRCADGTVFEQAGDYRARVLTILQQNEVGYPTSMGIACNDVGAQNVAIFGTNVGGLDMHSAAAYVGDAGFTGSASLVRASVFALESWRVLGPELLVGPMIPTPVQIEATVTLYDDPAKFDANTITTACDNAILAAFGQTGAYGYDLDALFGAMVEVSDAIQNVSFTTPTTSVGLLTGSPLWFPQQLARYYVPTNGITLTFVGPN